MAFIFSTSHLPETRVGRLDHLEDEEDDDVMQPMPRAGGVRAFSHLPVRDNPAASTSPLRADSPRRGIAPIPPRSATPSTSEPPMSEALDDASPPEAESDPEDDTAPQDHADDRPWYMPRITAQDLPPQAHPEDAHAPTPKPWENTTPSSRFYDTPPADRSTSSTRSSGFSPSPRDLRDDFHSPTPGSPTREAAAQDSRPALPRGRIFEKRLPPGLRGQSSGQFQSLADKPEYHDLVYRPSSADNGRHQADGFLQNVADTRATRQTPSSPKAPQTFAQTVKPAAQPAQKSGQTTYAAPPPAPGNAKDLPPTFKVDPADESKEFMLKDPVTDEKYPSDRTFGDHVRSILQEELEKSPTARNLLERIIGKTGKPVIIKSTTKPEAYPELARDGTLTVYINPTNLRIGTLTHEITHLLQTLALIKALAMKEIQAIKDPEKHSAAVADKIRELLNGILPVSLPEERNGDLNTSQDYIENEAVRAANIAKAEISAARVKERLDAMNETERASYQNNHAKLAALFWTEQGLHEAPGHDGNVKTTLEIDQRYGESHFEHVLKILGITEKELMDACPYKEPRDKAAAERAKKSQPSGKAGGR